jgi:SAM-dependent methyltransferase
MRAKANADNPKELRDPEARKTRDFLALCPIRRIIRRPTMVALYTATVFIGAALLFFVEPMFARMVLPLLGGSPSVWNTAMVFYQVVLLAAYGYAHASTRWLGVRRHAAWHLLVLLAPLAILPIAIPAGWPPPTQGHPISWLLGLMLAAVGLPFFAVAATSPLIQKWFASTGHRHAADPYFLYSASNAGSMLALLSYPVWVEWHWRLAEQSRWWMWGYGSLVMLTMACAVCLWRSSGVSSTAEPTPQPPVSGLSDQLAGRRRLRWVLLAFVPSSLMLSVTTYLSSNVAVVPLMWVVPLTIYLLTFILAFARHQILSPQFLSRALPVLLAPLVMTLNMRASEPIGPLTLLHLTAFFVAAALCHTELAADRPVAAHLTEFYLWISVGGALGGLFNALVAPLVFHSVVEYPLMLVGACLIGWRAADRGPVGDVLRDCLWPAVLTLATAGALLTVHATSLKTSPIIGASLFGVPTLVCYLFSRRPLRFALSIAGLLLIGGLYDTRDGQALYATRSFFGVHRVEADSTGRYHLLFHGPILHGIQCLDPARRQEPLAYYARTGPIGQVLADYGGEPSENIAVVGLGTGTLSCYARPGQRWTYFEIDPTVLKLASDERFFTFLRDAVAPPRIVLGDARLSLAAEPDRQFDLLILDAYSSDAIPVHLVTREALALYLRKLAPGGHLAFHISNTHLDLEPVLADLARDAHVACLTREDLLIAKQEFASGKAASVWVVMARNADELVKLMQDPRWRPSHGHDRPVVWTDDYSSLLSILRWR